jgi:hypothetical protein
MVSSFLALVNAEESVSRQIEGKWEMKVIGLVKIIMIPPYYTHKGKANTK